MSNQTDNYLNLNKYGLSEEEGKVYILLLKGGFLTALAISRSLHIGRTKVYRLLDKLIQLQLVEQKIEERGMQFGAANPERIAQLIHEKEREIVSLKQSLPEIVTQLQQLSHINTSQSKVVYYNGIEGLKQLSYNITRAEGILRVFEMEHLSDFLPKEFAEEVRGKLVERKVTTRDLTNKSSFLDFTDNTEMIEKYSEYRHIDPTLLKIKFETLIYNNVYATYTYKDNQIFCVEIYNDALAQMQKQIYDFIWNHAKPMQFVSNKGAAKVI